MARNLPPVCDLTVFSQTERKAHVEASQSAGKVPVRVRDLDADLVSLAGHKLYAPKGVGALYVRRGTTMGPSALGAGHERGLRPGTENVASIVGLGAACVLAHSDMAQWPGASERCVKTCGTCSRRMFRVLHSAGTGMSGCPTP